MTAHRLSLPLVRPCRTSFGTEYDKDVILIEVTNDSGATGWGECVAAPDPLYSHEFNDAALLVLGDHLVPRVLDRDLTAALRIYDPVKQQFDHDPTGEFVRRWVPEPRDVPDSLLATPWLVAADERHDYPDPIVDHAAAVARAKRRIGAVRTQIRGDGLTRALLDRHGSRRPPPARRRR